jgi:Rrf2 family protein
LTKTFNNEIYFSSIYLSEFQLIPQSKKIIVTIFVTIEISFTFATEMNNTRFATAIHILTLLANTPEEWLSSEFIAGSINVNPVIVRKELAILNEAGLVMSRKGKEGGSRLNKKATEISLDQVYRVVKNTEVLGKKNQKTNPLCPVGQQINEKLSTLFTETDHLVMESLKEKSLANFAKQFV